MIVLRWSMPTLVLVLVTLVATLPWGVGLVPRHVLPLLPFVVAYVFLTVTDWPVPSPTIFACGLLMDATGDGPLGYWALIYLAGTMIAQQLPRTLTESRLLRLSSLLFMAFAMAAIQILVATVYYVRWVDWHAILAGTLIAASGALLAELGLLLQAPVKRPLNVTSRLNSGGGGGA